MTLLKFTPSCNYLFTKRKLFFTPGISALGGTSQVGINMPAWNLFIFSQVVLSWGWNCSFLTRESDQFPEMLHADHPAGLPSLTKWDGRALPNPITPPPPQQLHFTCDLTQPVVKKEPLNTSPKLLWLEGLWLPSSAGPSFLLFLFSLPTPSHDSFPHPIVQAV